MAGAFWSVVEDDRQGNPKKVMAEVLGEAGRLAAKAGGQAEAVWLTDKASDAGLKQLGEWGGVRPISRRGVGGGAGRSRGQGVAEGDLRSREHAHA
jgi:hypothetical protein